MREMRIAKRMQICHTAVMLLLAFMLPGCGGKAQEQGTTDTTDVKTDYTVAANWAYYGIGEHKDVDLFLIGPTVDVKAENNMALDDEETRGNFVGALNMECGIYEESARMFAPYYR